MGTYRTFIQITHKHFSLPKASLDGLQWSCYLLITDYIVDGNFLITVL